MYPLSPSPELTQPVPATAETSPRDAGRVPARDARVLREGKVMGMAGNVGGFSPRPRPVRYLSSYLLYYFALLCFITRLLHSHLFCSFVKPANNVFALGGLTILE